MNTETQKFEEKSPSMKKEELKNEQTVPGKFYVPPTDIVETETALLVMMDIPGVDKEHVSVHLEKDVLKMEGYIDSSPYLKAHPIYTEYNVGHYARSFSVSKAIDREHIEADLKDGVLTLRLPKALEAQPKQIPIH